MSFSLEITIIIALIVILLGSGMWVASALALTGVISLLFLLGGSLHAVGRISWDTTYSMILTAVPMFVFMGEVLLRSGVSDRLYSGVSTFVGRLPGGLLHSNIAACSIFAAVSGSSIATAATISTVAIPEMAKRGYDARMTVGSLAAGGTLGILIPPSITMIIYGAFVGESVGQLFIGGVIPGIMMAALFMGYIWIRAWLQPGVAPRETGWWSWKSAALSLIGIAPTGVLIFLVLGTIYLGVATPTEAAAIGACGALVLALAYRRLNWPVLKESLLSGVRTTCMILFIVVGALILSNALTNLNVPGQLTAWLLGQAFPALLLLVLIYVLYILLGMFFDPISIMMLTLPFVYPLMRAQGYDSVWFGVVLVVLIELGLLSPPVGLNLYVIKGIAPQYSFEDIVRGVVPFMAIQVLMIALLTVFPILALWLPSQMIAR